jgi:hypothetical protein
MPALTRRRDLEAADECWHVYYGDVRVGTIAKRVGIPPGEDPWGWSCGLYSGGHPRECTNGAAATFDQARAEFEEGWRVFPLAPDGSRFSGVALRPGLYRVEISHVGHRAPAANAVDGRPIEMLLRRWPDDRRRARPRPFRASGNSLMKFATERPFADPDKAARKLIEIANTVEAVQDGRIHIEKINWPFLQAGGSADEYVAGL